LANEEEDSEETAVLTDLEKCTKQPVLNARKNVKYLSSQQTEGQFSAKIATKNTSLQDSNLIRFF